MGMLAWFVNGYLNANLLTPTYILLLFIVSVLALAWAIFTLFSYHRSSSNARFVALVDLAFFGALIAGVYYQRFIAAVDCATVQPGSPVDIDLGIFGSASLRIGTGLDVTIDKTCSMLKACFALGIMNVVFFFVTAVLAWIHGDRAVREERRYVETRRVSHSRHRSHSHSRSRHGGGSRHSSHSRHSHRRAYV
ncbi:uncharacterized protein THITE_2117482 [Thermothielavioides terrestris NRRL 8126]|jgi:hypothetical protein|uniref:MARVEL domain-containing protein n=2 Tax=Thermothielavioides terrestris TaxID=2587410 RepID=G2R846_THETT|nr:uncharacterized protein THITE_2117482 [Thermothielavioides terrestris NRRL 8126]AEO68105.1 hypothetical protein THITE_2117482 [Thermothielavioides terrestris NRRL 8126]